MQKAQKVVEACLPHAQKSVRIGITGVPGVGKSTFIEAFGTYLVSQGKKVAVLAVDPSSSVTHGSIMGDKTRMEKLVTLENAFIRPSPPEIPLAGWQGKQGRVLSFVKLLDLMSCLLKLLVWDKAKLLCIV
jgi:LAO/AO transport system kinase